MFLSLEIAWGVRIKLCSLSLFKEEKDTDPTVLGRWRRVVHAGDMYDSVSSVHSGQQGHMGYKKTLYEVRDVFKPYVK